LLGKLVGRFFRSDFVGPKPFGKNGPTGREFIVQGEPDFMKARERLRSLLEEFHRDGESACDRRVHGFFGRLSGAEWGITQYKHIDHHLRQFGA
jgi:hypothetical protein